MYLRACFRDSGITQHWHPVTGGNPCDSPLVDRYLLYTEKEQTRAGVKLKRAPSFQPEVYEAMASACITDAQTLTPSDPIGAFQALQDAFILALLFHCPLRSADVLDLRQGDVSLQRPLDGGNPSLRVIAHLEKSFRAGGQPRIITIPATGTTACPVVLFQAVQVLATELDTLLPPCSGHLLRPVKSRTRKTPGATTQPFSYAYVQGLITRASKAAGQPAGIKVHSFRAAAALAALSRGDHQAQIERDFNWAPGGTMFKLYTDPSRIII